jgi:ankyrin repeat protein
MFLIDLFHNRAMQERKPLKENIQAKKLPIKADIAKSERPALSKEEQDRLNANLLAAAYDGKTGDVKRLLKAGANIAAKDNNGRTALMHAAENGHTETCKFLLERNADIEAKDKNGRTALMHAAENGHTETCKLLLENNANLETKDNDGRTALMFAAMWGRTEIANFLKPMESLQKLIGKEMSKEFMFSFGECIS